MKIFMMTIEGQPPSYFELVVILASCALAVLAITIILIVYIFRRTQAVCECCANVEHRQICVDDDNSLDALKHKPSEILVLGYF
jgi:hypothetical protein